MHVVALGISSEAIARVDTYTSSATGKKMPARELGRCMRRFVIGFTVLMVLALPAVASADDHLANTANSQGVGSRGFVNPVARNPSGTAGAAAQQGTVPGLGNPNFGGEQGAPAFSADCLAVRLHDRAGHPLPYGVVCD